MGDEYIIMYDLNEQVEDLAKVTGMGKHTIRRVLKHQRRLMQDKLRLGYGVNLKGVVQIVPQERANGIVLTSTVAQSVIRPITIKTIAPETTHKDILTENMIEDEDLM